MGRFLWGLAAGLAGSGVTRMVTDDLRWVVAVGVILAVLVWCGEFLDELIP